MAKKPSLKEFFSTKTEVYIAIVQQICNNLLKGILVNVEVITLKYKIIKRLEW
jgi:hypothetical protein